MQQDRTTSNREFGKLTDEAEKEKEGRTKGNGQVTPLQSQKTHGIPKTKKSKGPQRG